MNDRDQTRHFEEDLNRLIERYRQEYEITVAAIVGTLTIKAILLTNEASAGQEDEE